MQISIQDIDQAALRIAPVAQNTPLQLNHRLSKKYKARVYLKREDLQVIRSFKIRGAYNKMAKLTQLERKRGVVTASAGNHAQGVAYSCFSLKIKGTIFLPITTPSQKIEKIKQFGDGYIKIKLVGDSFDDAINAAQLFCNKNKSVFIHPFNDLEVITGQATIAKEIVQKLGKSLDYVLCTEGGGGLTSGLALYLKQINKKTKIIGVEPSGAASMFESLKQDKAVALNDIDTFIDGAAVKTTGDLTFKIIKKHVDKILIVEEGRVCTEIIDLYQVDGIIAEPAGALSIASLALVADEIKGKTVVCILSGGNNDLLRYPEIVERSLLWQDRKHYFIIEFAQKPGQLKQFLQKVLGPTDDIVLFEYIKKNNREKGPALVGIELKDSKHFPILMKRLVSSNLSFKKIESSDLLYQYLV